MAPPKPQRSDFDNTKLSKANKIGNLQRHSNHVQYLMIKAENDTKRIFIIQVSRTSQN